MSLRGDIPHDSALSRIHLGVAGWNLRPEHAGKFSDVGSHLERYATRFNAVEINSSFRRPHRFATYQRWAASVPPDFRFAVKLPKVITHEQRLADVAAPLERFLSEISGLGNKLGPVLIQLPPKLAFDQESVGSFLSDLRARFDGQVVIEPRHETWFTTAVESLLVDYRIARVAADPVRVITKGGPGGYEGLVYLRLHGSPRMYYSAYPPEYLGIVTRLLAAGAFHDISTWCIFDNTAMGAATTDALTVKSHLLNAGAIKWTTRKSRRQTRSGGRS